MPHAASKCWPFVGIALFAFGACDAPQPSAPPSSGQGGAGGEPSGCSVELCSPYTCDQRFDACRTTCASTSECTAGFVCEAGFCVGTECTAATSASTCGGYACVNGQCAPDCALGPCAEGYYCRGDTNECIPKCTSRADPACAGYVCDVDVGECESYCFDGELPCAAGYACTGKNECTPDTSAPPCAAGCGAYVCVEALGRCATHCVVDDDCAAPATCAAGHCI